MDKCSKCGKEILRGSFSDATIPSPKGDGTEWHFSCGMDRLDELKEEGTVYWLNK
jgi:hypothetical protein